MKIRKLVATIVATTALLSAAVRAATVIVEQWNDATDEEGWEQGGSSYAGTFTESGGALQVVAGDPGGNVYTDRIYADSAGGVPGTTLDFAGNRDYSAWNGTSLDPQLVGLPISSVSFDFYADPSVGLPSALILYFVSDQGGNNYTWRYDVTTLLATGWNSYSVNMDYASGWSYWLGGRSGSEFATDITNIDEIGFELTYADIVSGSQTYAFDNFALNAIPITAIPEPGTFMVLGGALLSLCVTFRRRLNGAVSAMR